MEGTDLLATAFFRVVKSKFCDTTARRSSGHLEGGHHAVGHGVFDPGVQAFGVLPHDDKINIVVTRGHTGHGTNWTHRAVKIQAFSQTNIDGSESRTNRCRARTLQSNTVLANRVKGDLWQDRRITSIQSCHPRTSRNPLKSKLTRIKHTLGGLGHFRSDAITLNQDHRLGHHFTFHSRTEFEGSIVTTCLVFTEFLNWV